MIPPGGSDEVAWHRYAASRVSKHLAWARSEGLARLVEEDRLNPIDRITTGTRRRIWRHRHGVAPGTAVAVFVVGAQRSGTNMLVRGFESAPEFEIHNENDRRVFRRYRLRSSGLVRDVVTASRHQFVMFKPLCDSQHVDRLLDLFAPGGGRAIWAFRNVDDRARSAVAKFGPANRLALHAIATGSADGMWQAERVSEDVHRLIRSFDWSAMSNESAAAFFWYVRNRLVFDLGLEKRSDVLLSSYDDFLTAPEETMRVLCRFIGTPWRRELVAHVDVGRGAASRPRSRLDLDPRVRELCDDLARLLAEAAAAGRARVQAGAQ